LQQIIIGELAKRCFDIAAQLFPFALKSIVVRLIVLRLLESANYLKGCIVSS